MQVGETVGTNENGIQAKIATVRLKVNSVIKNKETSTYFTLCFFQISDI